MKLKFRVMLEKFTKPELAFYPLQIIIHMTFGSKGQFGCVGVKKQERRKIIYTKTSRNATRTSALTRLCWHISRRSCRDGRNGTSIIEASAFGIFGLVAACFCFGFGQTIRFARC